MSFLAINEFAICVLSNTVYPLILLYLQALKLAYCELDTLDASLWLVDWILDLVLVAKKRTVKVWESVSEKIHVNEG